MRATIVVPTGIPSDAAAAEAWFARWRPHLTYCSENTGCGCCVDIWDVDGPDEAIADLPVGISAMSEWTHPDIQGKGRADDPHRPRTLRRKRRWGR